MYEEEKVEPVAQIGALRTSTFPRDGATLETHWCLWLRSRGEEQQETTQNSAISLQG